MPHSVSDEANMSVGSDNGLCWHIQICKEPCAAVQHVYIEITKPTETTDPNETASDRR